MVAPNHYIYMVWLNNQIHIVLILQNDLDLPSQRADGLASQHAACESGSLAGWRIPGNARRDGGATCAWCGAPGPLGTAGVIIEDRNMINRRLWFRALSLHVLCFIAVPSGWLVHGEWSESSSKFAVDEK